MKKIYTPKKERERERKRKVRRYKDISVYNFKMNDPVRLPDIGQNGQPTNASSRNNSLANSTANVNHANSSERERVTNSNGERLPPLRNLGSRTNPYNQTTASNLSENSKKILRWHLWWDKQNSDLRVPVYDKPNKNVDARIGSLQNVTYRPGDSYSLVFFLSESE